MEAVIEGRKKSNYLGDRKICHIITNLRDIGGAERMLLRVLLAEPESASNRLVLVLRHGGKWAEELKLAGVAVQEFGMDSFLELPMVFMFLIRCLRNFQPDIVQTWMYHSDFLGGLAAYASGFRNIVWGIRIDALSHTNSKNTILVMLTCALLSRWVPRKIICVAEAAKLWHSKMGYDANRMVVVSNGFDFSKLKATPQEREELRKACQIGGDELVVGFLARFSHSKSQDNFVKAAGIVAEKTSLKVKFMLVGRNCDSKNVKLMGWIKKCNVLDRFVLLGERHDVSACLAAMDVYCMPSKNEGFPNALGEAMAMGLPCVATDVGDTKVLVGDTALLVPSQDSEALAAQLLTLIGLTKGQRQQMGLKAKKRVTEEFTIEKTCERFNAVYNEILTGKV